MLSAKSAETSLQFSVAAALMRLATNKFLYGAYTSENLTTTWWSESPCSIDVILS